MFRTNPKQLVERLARNLYGLKARVRVTGGRADAQLLAEDKSVVHERGDYVTRLFVDGEQKFIGVDRNWRRAYDSIVAELKTLHDAKRKERLLSLSVQTPSGS